MDTLWQDIRYGIRMLLKAPGFSIVATIALALGIGANTAIFSVVNAVLLRPLPFPNSEQLMTVWENDKKRGAERGSASYPNFADWRDQNQVFDKMAAFHATDYTLTGNGDAVRPQVAVVSANIFELLGVAPVAGRTFLPEEDKPGDKGRVVVLSHELFQKRFSAKPELIGQSILLDGKAYTVVGVMPPGFQFPIQNEPVELWTTFAVESEGKEPMTAQRGAHYIRVMARLKPGITKEQAQTEMTTIAARLEQQYPDKNLHRGVVVIPALEALVGDIRPALLILLGAVGCVLVIACANVANLLLARAMTRHKEMAVRAALGASRWRVARQLITESVLLSLAGGALGLLLALWWSDLLVALNSKNIPRAMQVGLDLRVLGFTLMLSVLTGLVFGLAPALHSSGLHASESLKEGGRGGGARRNRVRAVLVVAELSIAVVLLVGAGLLIRSLWQLRQVSPGFDSHNVLTFTLGVPSVRYPTEKQGQFFNDLITRIQSLPGVQSASVVTPLPLSGDRFSLSFETEGRPVAKGEEPSADFYNIGLGYFRTLGIPLLKGRDFTSAENLESPGVIIVNQAFAKKFFPNEEALGKRIKPGISVFDDKDPVMREIVGIVGDVKHRSLSTEVRPAFYVPQAQVPFDSMTVTVKTVGDPQSILSSIQNEIHQMDKDLPLFGIKSLDDYVADSVATPRFNTTLLTLFATVALILTVVGLYGVMSYSVAQRTNEIGIRMALGAQARDVLRLIVGQGLKMVLIGLAIGLAGAFALTRLIASFVVRCRNERSIDFRSRSGSVSVGDFAGVLSARAPCHESGSYRSATIRMRIANFELRISKLWPRHLILVLGPMQDQYAKIRNSQSEIRN